LNLVYAMISIQRKDANYGRAVLVSI